MNGLPKKMDDDELLQLFIRYHVNKAKIKSKGYGIVYFDRKGDAEQAYDVMNGYEIGRKRIKIKWKKEES